MNKRIEGTWKEDLIAIPMFFIMLPFYVFKLIDLLIDWWFKEK